MTDRDRLIELIGSQICDDYSLTCDEWEPHSCEKCYVNNCTVGKLADYLLSNGVIVPPCKVGQTIYRIGNGKIWEWDITVIEVYPDEIALVDDGDNYIKPSEIGKTVFLTKEEAEAKLKELNKDA